MPAPSNKTSAPAAIAPRIRNPRFVRIAAAVLFAQLAGWMGSLPGAHAASNHLATVWQIGKRDNSSHEFKSDWDFSKDKDPTFVIGRSVPDQDWSGFHPGPVKSAQGTRFYPFTVVFQLQKTPKGTFYLDIDALVKRFNRIPQYLVEINGRKGKFYFHPKLSYDIGDSDGGWDIIFSNASLEVALPAAYFHQGENRLVLTCLDEPGDDLLPREDTSNENTGIYYDVLTLANDSDRRFDDSEMKAEAYPTVFFHSHGDDSLWEVLVLQARVSGRLDHASADLLLHDQHYACQLASEYDFGESQCVLEVPEFTSVTPVRLTLGGGGRIRSYRLSLDPQKKFKLFLVPQIHLDPGYDDYRPNSYEVNDRNLDDLIQELESHPQYKYTPDGSWLIEDYLAHRGMLWQQRLVRLLQADRISLPAQLFNTNTNLMSQEELNHLAYLSEELHRRYGITYEDADLCDVPAGDWSLPSYLQSIGVKHLVVGGNLWRAPMQIFGQLNRRSPFWWEGPDGSKVLTWYSRVYLQMEMLFGAPGSLATGIDHLPIFLQDYASASYAPDAVMIYGLQVDNAPFNPRLLEITDAWNKEFAYPRITVANMKEFFGYMEQHYGSSFPTLRGDGGAWWEEMAFSDAYYAGIVRKAKARAVTAETLASLGVIANQDFRFPLPLDHDMWSNILLHSEHIWGYSREWSHPESQLGETLQRNKESFTTAAAQDADDLLRRGFDQLYSKINAQADLVVIFNPLSWRRSGLVEVEIPRGSGLTDLKTQQPVQLELLRRVDDETYDRVRFLAEDLPSLGYRSYEVGVRPALGPTADVPASSGTVIENAFYRIAVDPSRGGVSSIFDKQLGRELVNRESPYALDQYVYAGYGHEEASLIRQRDAFNSTLLTYSTALPAPDLQVGKGGALKTVSVRRMPWGSALLLENSGPHTPRITTEIRLFDREKRIELINTMHKDVVRAPEGVYFAFPFVGRKPTIRYDIQNGWVNPTRDQLPGANKEWFAAQHWIAVSDEKGTVALAVSEAPLFTIGDIVRGRWPSTFEVRNGTVFSYVMNNYDGDDERPYQGGEFTFHYVIDSERQFDPTALSQLGLESNRPLEVDASRLALTRTGTPPEPLTPEEQSFLHIADPAILLSAWKGAEDGEGYILRFYNTSDRSVSTQVEFPNLEFDSLNRTNPVEVNRETISSEQGRITLALQPHEIYSLRVRGFRLRQSGGLSP